MAEQTSHRVRQYSEPYDPGNWYYVRYTYDGGYGYEVHECWLEDEEQYIEFIKTKQRHARYDVHYSRRPAQKGLMKFGR